MYKGLIRPFLFLFDPESVHYFTFRLIRITSRIPFVRSIRRKKYCVNDKLLERKLFGLTFKNPVGVAAGLDKNAVLLNQLGDYGFGFIEIGTVTPKPQDGNPKPRLFRLRADQGIINRMGFNNNGADVVADRLKNRPSNIIIGGNIGKNKITANENAKDDYVACFHALFDYVDYFVVNVSSPNTPNLRALQEKEPLTDLLRSIQSVNNAKQKRKPILLKIAPDLTDQQLDDIIEIVKEVKLDGVIATNTTVSRNNLQEPEDSLKSIGDGGVSGRPVFAKSNHVIRYLSEKSGKAFPIIGVGGIHSPEDALAKLAAGANLVQIFTGFIYEGPKLVRNINRAILKHGQAH